MEEWGGRARACNGPSISIADIPGGQAESELSASGLVKRAAPQSRTQYVQFGFRHGAFQPQQQTVIEMARVVQSVFVQDQRLGQRADLQ